MAKNPRIQRLARELGDLQAAVDVHFSSYEAARRASLEGPQRMLADAVVGVAIYRLQDRRRVLANAVVAEQLLQSGTQGYK